MNSFTPTENTKYLADLTDEQKEAASVLSSILEASVFMAAPYLRSAARSRPDFDLKTSHHDIVTFHDKHVEHMFRDFFTRVIPESTVLGEEAGEQEGIPETDLPEVAPAVEALPNEVREAAADLGDRVRFIVDPIDGTANFAAGLTHFGSSAAAELDGRVVAGAVSTPLLREAIVGDWGTVWHAQESGEREQVRAKGPRSEAEAVIVCYYPRLKNLEQDPLRAAENERDVYSAYSVMRRPGAAALDLAMVAAGWVGAMLGTSFSPWDVAAGIHLVRAAGGEVLNLPLGTDEPDGLRPGLAASVSGLDAATARRILREEQAQYDREKQV